MKKSILGIVMLFNVFCVITANAQRTNVYCNDDMYMPTREVHIGHMRHHGAMRHGRVVEVRHHPAAYREVRYVEPARVEVVRPVHHRTVVVAEPVPVPVPAPAPVVVHRPHHSSSAVTGMVVGAVLGTVIGAMVH
ncbi:MAG: hypothetical protein IKN75_09000 [Prevotella sp.]|nr:hypothetical protein [Prevotella sp.]